MICNKCGQDVPEGAKFCNNCGNPMNSDPNQNSYQNPYPNYNQNYNQGYNQNVYRDPYVNMNPTGTGKSRVAAGVLGILLGSLGIHNFYLGYTNKGIAQLLITILSCGILGIVSSIWGLVEGIQILTGTINVDSDGNPLIG